MPMSEVNTSLRSASSRAAAVEQPRRSVRARSSGRSSGDAGSRIGLRRHAPRSASSSAHPTRRRTSEHAVPSIGVLAPFVAGRTALQSCLTRAVRGLRDSGEVAPSAPPLPRSRLSRSRSNGRLRCTNGGSTAVRRPADVDRRPASPSAMSGGRNASAIPRSSMGEKLPLVTSPTTAPPCERPGTRRAGSGGPRTRPRSRRATPRSRSATSGAAAPEVALVEAHHPAEPGLQRRDAGAELVAVQRQPGLEAQRVARAEPGRA